MAGKTFSEVLITSYFKTDQVSFRDILNVHIVNDGLSDLEDAEIYI